MTTKQKDYILSLASQITGSTIRFIEQVEPLSRSLSKSAFRRGLTSSEASGLIRELKARAASA